MIKLPGTFLNQKQAEQFWRNVEKVEKKRKTNSAKSVFQKVLAKVIGENHSAK